MGVGCQRGGRIIGAVFHIEDLESDIVQMHSVSLWRRADMSGRCSTTKLTTFGIHGMLKSNYIISEDNAFTKDQKAVSVWIKVKDTL